MASKAGAKEKPARPRPHAGGAVREPVPTAKPSRKEQAEMTRRRLEEAALRLFASRGFERVTVDDICREAGVSKGAFYVYFKSKDQVLVEQFISLDRFYLDSLAEITRVEGGVERLAALGRYSLRHLSALGKDYLKAAYSSQMAPGRGPSSLAAKSRASYRVALRLVKEAQGAGELRADLSSEEIALALVRAVRGLVFEWCLTDGRFDLEEAGEPMLRIVLDGLRPREDGGSPRLRVAPRNRRR